MIYSIRGKLISISPNFAVVECSGVGYGIRTSAVSISRLPSLGEEVTFYTYLHVTENMIDLFGFCDENELNCFKMLITVTRVGPKAALSVLSSVTPEKFALCVASQDAKTIAAAPGLGLKTAQRIILELKDKITKEQLASGIVDISNVNLEVSSNASEAISALVVLGYSQPDATSVITKLDPTMSVEDMIKHGLKALVGKV